MHAIHFLQLLIFEMSRRVLPKTIIHGVNGVGKTTITNLLIAEMTSREKYKVWLLLWRDAVYSLLVLYRCNASS
jgi:Holliday junction resolvasome RuvABC ATP-dependent DNA helicase subunit